MKDFYLYDVVKRYLISYRNSTHAVTLVTFFSKYNCILERGRRKENKLSYFISCKLSTMISFIGRLMKALQDLLFFTLWMNHSSWDLFEQVWLILCVKIRLIVKPLLLLTSDLRWMHFTHYQVHNIYIPRYLCKT